MMERSLPPQCELCPAANLLFNVYNQAARQESDAIRVESEARVQGDEDLARIASSALVEVSHRRRLIEAGLYGIEDCPGYTDKCGKGIEL